MSSKGKAMVFSICGGTLLVFLGLFGGVYSLTEPFGVSLSPAVFGVVCLSALLGGLLCSLDSFRLRALLALAVCAVVALGVWRQWDSVFLGAQGAFHLISRGVHQELPQILYYELPVALSGQELSAHVSRFVAACVPLLSLWLGFWVLRGRAVWPGVVAVCALAGMGPAVLREPGTLGAGAALLFLTLVALSRRGYQQSVSLGARRTLAAAVPVVLVMALIGAVFPAGGYQRWAWAEDLRLRTKSAVQSFAFSGGGSRPGSYTFQRFGSPRFDGHTVLTVQSQEEQYVLLRGWSSAVYTRYGWRPLDDEALGRLPAFSDETRPWSYPAHAALDSGQAVESQSIQIVDVASGSDYYFVPYFPTSMYSGAVFRGDSYIQRQSTHFQYSFDYVDPDQVPAGATVGWDGGNHYGEREYREFVYRNYLDVPYDLLTDEALEVIQAAIRAADGNGTVGYSVSASFTDQRAYQLHRAKEVARYLASFTRYDLSAPAQPLGQDFVSYFLTTSHRGYCAHYASAVTLILREMGIPARFVGGYAAELPGGDEAVAVPDQNAHAWVELYIDGFGWQPVNVTPGGAYGRGQEQEEPAAAATPSPSPSDEPSQTPSAQPSDPSQPSQAPSDQPQASQGPAGPAQREDGSSLSLGPALALLGLLVLAGGVWLQRRIRLGRWRGRCAQEDPNAAAVWLYRYLEALQKRRVYTVPDRTLALAQKATFSQHRLTQEERREMEGYARRAFDTARSAPPGRRLLLQWVWCLC